MTSNSPAWIVLTPGGLSLARRLQQEFGSGLVYAPGNLPGDVATERVAHDIARLFAAGTPIIGICAAGILIRALAPSLHDKHLEPPVLAVAEDGSAVVPLLGGHRGANTLARQIAAALGIAASITTASDLVLGGALDAMPRGWRIADNGALKPAMAALLASASARLTVEAGDAAWLADFVVTSADGTVPILVTDRNDGRHGDSVVLHPPVLALGVGCERGTDPEEVIALAIRTLDEHHLAHDAVACVVSIDLKADEAAIHALAARLGVPARFFDAETLARETPRLQNPSEAVFKATGCWGVAEAAALAAVGPSGDLVIAKHKSRRATVAVARAATDVDPEKCGQPRGSLAIIGIGPGAANWRVPAADLAIAHATQLVGYGLYLDLLGPVIQGKPRHQSELGAEEDRARRALELAAQGEAVALICSGDAGIYALASLVFELLDREDRPDWRRVAIEVIPGVSAMQAAAARAGAPLGHDFCAISLSDLLTSWETIEARLKAVAAADFVVALYNPRSQRRTTQLSAARSILLEHRPENTPVVLARNLGRPDEAITLTSLAALDPEQVDMLTLVLIGNSTTRAIPGSGWIYTPRGYAKKHCADPGKLS